MNDMIFLCGTSITDDYISNNLFYLVSFYVYICYFDSLIIIIITYFSIALISSSIRTCSVR